MNFNLMTWTESINKMNEKKYKYFNISEFDCKSTPGSGSKVSHELIKKLDIAREHSKCSYTITSGYRSKKHTQYLIDKGYKTSMTSSHIKGLAADIAVENGPQRMQILKGLLYAGFNRVGISQFFIHCDIDKDKPQNTIWTY
jgi:uncharacterized protein YcbK (DUF882 family)